jgi:outer membrane protein TolC
LNFTLSEAQNYAVENFFLSKNAELDIESAKKRILEATALGLPQVTATADFQYIPNPPTISFPSSENPDEVMEIPLALETNLSYGASVTQLIFNGEYIVGLQAAKVYRKFAEENYDNVAISIRENVASTYFALLILQKNSVILEKTLDNLRVNLGQVQKTFAAGMIEDTEVDQIALSVKRTENELSSLDNQLETLRKMLKYQMGLPADAEVTLSESIDELITKNMVEDSTYNFVLEENSEYKLLETQEQLQKLNMNRYKTNYLPTLSAFYNYSDQTESSEFSQAINHVFGATARWPLLTSGMRHAQISQARIEYEKASNTKLQETERLILVAEQAKFNFQTALNKYNNEKENFAMSENIFNKTTQRYKEGFVSSLDLTLINTQYLQAQITYAYAVQELLTSKIALDKAHNKL